MQLLPQCQFAFPLVSPLTKFIGYDLCLFVETNTDAQFRKICTYIYVLTCRHAHEFTYRYILAIIIRKRYFSYLIFTDLSQSTQREIEIATIKFILQKSQNMKKDKYSSFGIYMP